MVFYMLNKLQASMKASTLSLSSPTRTASPAGTTEDDDRKVCGRGRYLPFSFALSPCVCMRREMREKSNLFSIEAHKKKKRRENFHRLEKPCPILLVFLLACNL